MKAKHILNDSDNDKLKEEGKKFIHKYLFKNEAENSSVDRYSQLKEYVYKISTKLNTASSLSEISYYTSLLTLVVSAGLSTDSSKALGLLDAILNQDND